MVDVQYVENLTDHESDKVINRLRLAVEAGHGGHDDRTGLRRGGQVAKVDQGQRSLTWDEHQWAALFEHDVSRALRQVIGHAVCDRRQKPHRAGHHDHRIRAVRPGRHRIEQVVRVGDSQVLGVGQFEVGRQRDRSDLPVLGRQGKAEFECRHLSAGVREDDGHVVSGENQLLDHAHPIDAA